MRIGIGFDVHRLVAGRKLMIGTVHIPYGKGALGHSDADVLTHAICDAMLGAAALGDIGLHFPDTDDMYKNISGEKLLKLTLQKVNAKGFSINNIDSVIILETPKIAAFIPAMRANIAKILELSPDVVSVKATSTEGLGFTGDGKGIAAKAVVSIM